MIVCPITNHAVSYAYHHLKCRCVLCVSEANAHRRNWSHNNRDRQNEVRRAYYHENKEKFIGWLRKKKYSMSKLEFDLMALRQNNQCLICQRSSKLMIDHNHVTGKVRGLLCRNCNIGIGQFRDTPEIVDRASFYLRNY